MCRVRRKADHSDTGLGETACTGDSENRTRSRQVIQAMNSRRLRFHGLVSEVGLGTIKDEHDGVEERCVGVGHEGLGPFGENLAINPSCDKTSL